MSVFGSIFKKASDFTRGVLSTARETLRNIFTPPKQQKPPAPKPETPSKPAPPAPTAQPKQQKPPAPPAPQKNFSKRKTRRANEIMKERLNRMAKNGGLDEQLATLFYRSTFQLWSGEKDRIQAILAGLGVATLAEAYAVVMSNNKDLVTMLENRTKSKGFGLEKREDSDRQDSPEWLAAVTFV